MKWSNFKMMMSLENSSSRLVIVVMMMLCLDLMTLLYMCVTNVCGMVRVRVFTIKCPAHEEYSCFSRPHIPGQATHNVPNQEIPTIVICNQPQYRETCDWTTNQTLSLSKQGLSKCLNHVTIFACCKIRT